MAKNVEDIEFEEFLNFSESDFESYSDSELGYLFDKFYPKSDVYVTVRDLLERFSYDVSGWSDGVLGLSFSCDFGSSFIRRGKIVFSDGVDGDEGSVELILDKDSVDSCVEFRSGGGRWVYSALGGLLSVS